MVISELIGHIAFEEGIIESLIDAKERFLIPNGIVIPERVQLKGALIQENVVYPEYIDCWKYIEGIDYSHMREEAVKACYLTEFDDRNLLSDPKEFFAVDFRGIEVPSLCGSRIHVVNRSGEVNGIALWFDARLYNQISLSSGPWTRTHWRTCFAPLGVPITVKAGDKILVTINMQLRINDQDGFKFDFNIKQEV